MKIIKPSFIIEEDINGQKILEKLEKIGRVCYKSEDKIKDESAEKFISGIIKSGHESVLEHEKITVRFICDRAISHEIVRHRMASYSQESTRYVNYQKKGLQFIQPCWFVNDYTENINLEDISNQEEKIWLQSMILLEKNYNKLIEKGWTAQEARSILPNSLKTELVMTSNIRGWRNFFRLRCPKSAHPQMRELSIPLLKKFQELIPILFDDLEF